MKSKVWILATVDSEEKAKTLLHVAAGLGTAYGGYSVGGENPLEVFSIFLDEARELVDTLERNGKQL